MSEKIIYNLMGQKITIDTSNQALEDMGCAKFVNNRTVVDPWGDTVIMEGVGFGSQNWQFTKVIWFSCPELEVCFFYGRLRVGDNFKIKE